VDVTVDPSVLDIELALGSAPLEHWRELWAALAGCRDRAPPSDGTGGHQVDTTVVDGAERPVPRMPHAIYADAVTCTIQALYDLGAIVQLTLPR
jgi:hypothetical protein